MLLRHLEDDEPPVKEACVNALGRIQPAALSPAVIPVLIDGLIVHAQEHVALLHAGQAGGTAGQNFGDVNAALRLLSEAEVMPELRVAGAAEADAGAGKETRSAQPVSSCGMIPTRPSSRERIGIGRSICGMTSRARTRRC